MREIRLRGKRKDNGEWVYGYPIIVSYKAWIKDINDTTTNPRRLAQDFADFRCVEVEKETVGQYTGLKDKNGVEIYEGDVVRHYNKVLVGEPDEFYCGVIEWNESRCRMELRANDSYTFGTGSTYEVIGNLHDNHELLGGM